ncbi:hypothetical protein KM043_010466 [Ampulex compressa]|nr:hypothetical protein KM043_010466 [Ampulex compressa]
MEGPSNESACRRRRKKFFQTQVNAWMDRAVFLDWFEHHFKPSVQKYQDEKHISGKNNSRYPANGSGDHRENKKIVPP